ncbi:MAG: DUF547 domain-containing protein [Planctomycetota bacterium]
MPNHRTASLKTNRVAPLAAVVAALVATTATGADTLVGTPAPASARVSHDAIDHAGWDALLRRFVDAEGRVDYRAWKATPDAVASLDAYLGLLSTGDAARPAAREATLAYWINAYNAVTVKGILDVYPTTSIRNHTAKLWGYNIWKNLKLQTPAGPINLDSIEHKVLRNMNEPRIHFAIVCASIGCPRLLNEAYTADQLEYQLTANAEHFFAQRQNFQTDAGANTVRLSSILSWFGKDFGPNTAAQLATIGPYLPNDADRAFVTRPGVRVAYLDYDWGINEQ